MAYDGETLETMRKFIPLLLLFFFISNITNAQQDAMFTKYMFNTLSYNPAYALSLIHISEPTRPY